MDPDDLRSILEVAGVDLWTLMEAAIAVAVSDHGAELKRRRDRFVERLYAAAPSLQDNAVNGDGNCRNLNEAFEEAEKSRSRSREEEEQKGSSSPTEKVNGTSSPLMTPQSQAIRREEEEEDEDVHIADGDDDDDDQQEQGKIHEIRQWLKDPNQSDESTRRLLQKLSDMDITFKALKKTDIGRDVNGFRKHSSSEVRKLAKQLVIKWKGIVDDWVNANEGMTATIIDGDSTQQTLAKSDENGNQPPKVASTPNTNYGRDHASSYRNSLETVQSKVKPTPKREAPSRVILSKTHSSAPPAMARGQNDSLVDDKKLADARKRLHENYQEAENAKRQRTIQVMDIHQIPKPKNSFIARNKSGNHQHSKYQR